METRKISIYVNIVSHSKVTFDAEGDANVVDFIRMPYEHIEQGVTEATRDQETIHTEEDGDEEEAEGLGDQLEDVDEAGDEGTLRQNSTE